MNIARLNLTHCTHEFAKQVIKSIRQVQKDIVRSEVAILIDVNGPKVRTGKIAGGSVHLKKGDEFLFVNDSSLIGDHTKV
jgi:pyruvate kinase